MHKIESTLEKYIWKRNENEIWDWLGKKIHASQLETNFEFILCQERNIIKETSEEEHKHEVPYPNNALKPKFNFLLLLSSSWKVKPFGLIPLWFPIVFKGFVQ